MSDEAFLSRWSRRKAEVRRGGQPADEPVAADAAHTAGGAAPSPPMPGAAAVAPAVTAGAQAPEPPGPDAATTTGTPAQRAGLAQTASASEPAEPPPTLEDVARLPRGAEVSRFLAPTVDETVKRAALKNLFADPHFNVMDGLDIYIDDYSKPDPIPPAMLRRLAQSKALGLFDDAPAATAAGDGGPGADGASRATAGEARAPRPEASPDGAAASKVPQSADDSSAVPPDEDPDLRLQQDDAAGRGRAGEGADA